MWIALHMLCARQRIISHLFCNIDTGIMSNAEGGVKITALKSFQSA
ncbi:hypothetical protein QSI_3900 [Clostridioides difficile P28]|nr:hypothetical protein QSI_3900 [Clostridioides difficile P28]